MLRLKTAVVALIGLLSYASFTAESVVGYRYMIVEEHTCREMPVTVTWYTSSVDECDDTPFITADGSRTRHGIVAVSRDLLGEIAFGDSVYIEGHGGYVVHDTMNARWRRRVDIWCDDKQEAIRNGIQNRMMHWNFEIKLDAVTISLDRS